MRGVSVSEGVPPQRAEIQRAFKDTDGQQFRDFRENTLDEVNGDAVAPA